MTLAEWLKQEGRGALSRLHYDSRVSLPTLRTARDGYRVKMDVAVAISQATQGAVSVASLTSGEPQSKRDHAPDPPQAAQVSSNGDPVEATPTPLPQSSDSTPSGEATR